MARLLAAALAALILSPAHAWDGELSLGVGATYSDNINLAPPGQEESDLVLSVTPGLSVSREGGRIAFDFDYRGNGLLYAGDSERNNVFHQMSADANAELVPELFFLDANARYDQRLISSGTGTLGRDLVSSPSDFSNVLTYRFSPYVRPRLGSYANTELRYQYWVTEYAGDSDQSSQTDEIRLRIDSGEAFGRLGWSLRYGGTQVDYDDGTSTEFEEYRGRLRVDPIEQLGIYAEAGHENDPSDSGNARSRRSGNLWQLGVIWTPTIRTRAEIFYADRYFGNYFGWSLRHRFRSSTWAFDYQEEPSTAALTAPDVTGSGRLGLDEGPLLDEAGDPLVVDGDFPATTTDSFLRRRATLAVQGQRVRIGWGARLFYEERNYASSQQDETRMGAGLNLSYRIAPRTQVFGNLDWLRSDSEDEVDNENSQLVRFGLQHELGPYRSVSADYRFVNSEGFEGGVESYRENRVSVVFSAFF